MCIQKLIFSQCLMTVCGMISFGGLLSELLPCLFWKSFGLFFALRAPHITGYVGVERGTAWTLAEASGWGRCTPPPNHPLREMLLFCTLTSPLLLSHSPSSFSKFSLMEFSPFQSLSGINMPKNCIYTVLCHSSSIFNHT